MQEDFLHFLWRYQKFVSTNLKTTSGLPVIIEFSGTHNTLAGPDFLNGKLRIDGLLWNGPIELHLKASSWYHHRHHNDAAYDTVILHVVWEDDIEISLASGKLMPTLRLSDYVAADRINSYQSQFLKPSEFIPCEKIIQDFPTDSWQSWKERLFVERMEDKVTVVQDHLKETENDWEAVFFRMLCKGFGLNVNGQAFLAIAKSIPFKIIRKIRLDTLQLEALLMGQAGLLSENFEALYYVDLKNRYAFLKKKYQLKPIPLGSIKFSRLRPPNFPTIRLAQLAKLYTDQGAIFQRIIDTETPLKAAHYFKSSTSKYWKSHYNFGVESRPFEKKLSPRFFDLLLINTLLPIRFAYSQFQGLEGDRALFDWGSTIAAEHNSITTSFKVLGVPATSSLDSQSLLQLKKKYCDCKKCLSCALGFYFLKD